ncbi:MAG: TolC family protein [Bdellovibrionaceae bacterium]|nr:TolC family protein [Bdellovibrio sp.]
MSLKNRNQCAIHCVMIALVSLTASAAWGLTLNDYLNLVKQKNKLVSSYDLSIEASNDKREAGDLVLAPMLTAGYTLSRDQSQPSSLGSRREWTNYNLGLAKEFSSGTELRLTAQTNQFDNQGAAFPLDQYSTGLLGIAVEQSLWKNFFGSGTRLRQAREGAVNRYETLALELQKRLLLVEAESSFWDYAVAQDDMTLKKENFDRSQKLSSWTNNRVNNGISDRSDLMSVRALASLRELELANATDQLKVQELRLRQNLELGANEPTPVIEANESEMRPYFANLANQKNIIKIDAYMTYLDAKSKKIGAEEVKDELRPDLALVGGYNTTAYDRNHSEMQKKISNTDFPKSYVGVTFSWLFDTDAKSSRLAAAEKAALAAQYVADRNQLIGKDAWLEHIRRYEVAKKNVVTLSKIAEFQRARARAEQDKFSKGRTVTLNVVTAETDAATAEVAYLTAKSNLRKLEASTQLFVSIQE